MNWENQARQSKEYADKENTGKGGQKEREERNIHGAFWEGKSFNMAESQNVKQTEGHGPRGDWKNRGGNRVH